MVARLGSLFALALALVVAACSSGASPTAMGSASAGSAAAITVTEEMVGVGELLGQIRGHHLVSLALYRAGDQQGALTHAGHPVAEIFPALKPELDEHGGDSAALEAKLKEAADAIDDNAPADTVAALYEEVAALTVAAEQAVAGAAADSPAYKGSVIGALLVTAGREYEEAVADGAVRELIEFQDAHAFTTEAKRLYGAIEADVQSKAPDEAAEIDEAFTSLLAALPGPTPANTPPAAVDDVQQWTGLIGHELAEVVGAIVLESRDPEEVAETIGTLLDEMVEAYKAGRTEEALEIAAESYLENYEVIEAAVIANAPEINAELEPLLAAEMRATMREGKPVEELEAKVARAKDLLTQALAAIPMDH